MNIFFCLLVFSVVIAALAGSGFQFIGVPYAQDVVGEATKVVSALFVVTVFVERSTAVLASIWFGEDIRLAEADEILKRGISDRAPSSDATKAEAATDHRIKLESRQDRLRANAALVIAIFVSSVDVRTLEKLQDLASMHSGPTPTQLGLYHSADILITAGVISGYLLNPVRGRTCLRGSCGRLDMR